MIPMGFLQLIVVSISSRAPSPGLLAGYTPSMAEHTRCLLCVHVPDHCLSHTINVLPEQPVPTLLTRSQHGRMRSLSQHQKLVVRESFTEQLSCRVTLSSWHSWLYYELILSSPGTCISLIGVQVDVANWEGWPRQPCQKTVLGEHTGSPPIRGITQGESSSFKFG